MTKRFSTVYIILALCFLLLLPAATRAESDEAKDALRFGADGTFTVLALSDLQDTQYPVPQLISAVRQTLAENEIDLIVLLGDQLEGGSPLFFLGGTSAVETAIDRLLQPVAESGVPFAVLFGNHEYDAPMPVSDQARLYEAYAGCVGVSFGAGMDKSGAFSLPVYTYDGESVALRLYFFDSGDYLPNGDYGAVSKEQVAWFHAQSELYRTENANQPVPAVAFMHVPLPEIYELFTETDGSTHGAFKGVGVGKDRFFLPNEAQIFPGEVHEAPCPSSENNGLFDAFSSNDNVFLALSGHDHVNSFIGNLRGIDLASVPASTYTSYGDESARGVRLFRFTEHNVKDYETGLVRYADYNAAARVGYLRYYLTTTTRIPNLAKIALVAFVLLAAIVLVIVLLLRRKKRAASPAAAQTEPNGAAEPEASEFDEEPTLR